MKQVLRYALVCPLSGTMKTLLGYMLILFYEGSNKGLAVVHLECRAIVLRYKMQFGQNQS